MTRYKVVAPTGVAFHPGAVLLLSAAQIAVRAHALDALPGGFHRVKAPVSFKAGETIGFDGAPPKALEPVLADAVTGETAAARKARAVAEDAAAKADKARANAPSADSARSAESAEAAPAKSAKGGRA